MSSKDVIDSLAAKNLSLAIAESLTGGMLCSELVSVPGASKVILGSIVAYQTGLKSAALGVNADLLEKVGAVDGEVAVMMAEGVRSRLALQLMMDTNNVIGIATTGVAGPDTQDGKPVGLAYIAIVGAKGIQVWEDQFPGDRQAIRQQVTERAISHLREYLG
jgi:nicotinamide-nucleotide amidase